MSNHNGNANKMVSDTPRTDYAIWQIKGGEMVCPEFARQLERELNAANQRIKELEEACYAAVSAARGVAWGAQANWLIKNTTPNFKEFKP